MPKGQVIAHRVGTFYNMLIHHKKILFYTWRPELNMYSTINTQGNCPMDWLIGETLKEIFTKDNDCTQGLQFARLQIGNTTIEAFKRVHDIKVCINTIKNS